MPVIPLLLEPWFSIVRLCGRLFGYELGVVAGEHTVELKLVDPEDETVPWADGHYLHANIFPKNEVTPVNVGPDGDTRRSEEYRMFMNQSLLADFLGDSKTERWIILGLVSIAAIQMATIGLLLW